MNQQLLEQLNLWHEENEFDQIIKHIEQIPVQERDYDLVNHLARAFNNSERYREALHQLLSVADQGQNDPLWHYRAGYAYFYLALFNQALQAFETADRLDPDDEDTINFINWTRPKAEQMLRDQQRQRAEEDAAGYEQAPEGAPFASFPLDNFWENSSYALENYVSPPPTDELIASLEQELGYKLPASYIALMKTQNGGLPINTCFPTTEASSWATDHIAITSILGIGRDKMYSIGGELGSRFMIEEWGYPNLGIVICDCPSAGHDVVMLDYRLCGPDGEPSVVHVDQESDYQITYLARNFEAFIRGLVDEESFEHSDEDEEAAEAEIAATDESVHSDQELEVDTSEMKPFLFIDHKGANCSVILTVGSYKTEVFEARAEEGFEGNGYDWASLAAVFLAEKMPELAGIVKFDPEADMFCAYSDNKEALTAFILGFKAACEDDTLIRDLFSRAELD